MRHFPGPRTTIRALAFSPTGDVLAIGEVDIRLRDLATGRLIRTLDWHIPFPKELHFTATGHLLALGLTGAMAVLDPASGEPLWQSEPASLQHLALAPDQRVLIGSTYAEIVAIQLPNARRSWQRPLGNWVSSIAWRPDGHEVLLSSDSDITSLDPMTGVVRSIATGFDAAGSLYPLVDGRSVALLRGTRLWVVDLAERTPKLLAEATPPPRRSFHTAGQSHDGRALIVLASDHTVRVYDLPELRERSVFEWQIGPLNALAVARDGLRLAVGSMIGEVVVWDVD